MNKLRKLSVILLLASSLFMTGCDATQILDVITKVADGVQQAMPAIRDVVNTFSNAFGNGNNTNNTNNTADNNTAAVNNNNNQQDNVETGDKSQANVVTIDPNTEEVRDTAGQNATGTQTKSTELVEEIIVGAQIAVPYTQVGSESTLPEATAIKNKYGITILDGKTWRDKWNSAIAGKWTSEQLARFAAVMEKLPRSFRDCTDGFSMQKTLLNNDGGEPSGLGGDPIMISSDAIDSEGPAYMDHLVVHEMTHQFQANNPDALRQWAAKFWPNDRLTRSSISDYGNTDPGEDMAECVAEYFVNPEKMRQHDPERYEFIRQNIWK
ncbi:MAG: hypothetical protein CVV42_00555 [Candidatus Riflebacteria bacterium HGW-Riflebacteria-2]|jgi:hypothetical protein|nr:MAG: hypothetical protein CVV42_00555 [Candidatus Riflebacteria bacterium HGW-Riflebacteria-2]